MCIVKRIENETHDEICMQCVESYLKQTNREVFDYSKCSHCSLAQIIHQKDSCVWNGHCRFLR